MSKHTPGPWWYQEGADRYTHIVRAGEGFFVCQLSQDTSGLSEANARLIAKAPEMLAMLRELQYSRGGCSCPVCEAMNLAEIGGDENNHRPGCRLAALLASVSPPRHAVPDALDDASTSDAADAA